MGRRFGFQVLDHRRWAGFGAWGLKVVCSLWIVNQVLVRFGRAGRFGGFCGIARAVWRGWQGWSVAGLAWVSGLGVGACASGFWLQGRTSCSVQSVFECVLSEGFAVGRGLFAARGFGRWMVSVHGGVFGTRLRVCVSARGRGTSKRRASGGCLGARRR